MAKNIGVAKTQRELFYPKSFRTFETQAPGQQAPSPTLRELD